MSVTTGPVPVKIEICQGAARLVASGESWCGLLGWDLSIESSSGELGRGAGEEEPRVAGIVRNSSS